MSANSLGLELQIVDVDLFQVKAECEQNYLEWQRKLRLNAINLEQQGNYLLLDPYFSDAAAMFMVRLWCRSAEGESICLLVCDAARHMFKQLRSDVMSNDLASKIQKEMSAVLFNKTRGLAKCEVTQKHTTQGWRCDPSAPNVPLRLPWLKISVTNTWQAKGLGAGPQSWFEEVARLLRKPREELFGKDEDAATAHWNLDVRTEVLQAIGVRAGGWLGLPASLATRLQRGADLELLRCSAALQATTSELAGLGLPEKVAMAPLRVLSFDIECVSHVDGFPNAELPEDHVICIGLYCKVLGAPEASAECTMLCLHETEALPPGACPTRVLSFSTERELLCAFQRELCRLDADVVAGYNTCLFDWRYLNGRSGLLCKGLLSAQTFSRYAKLSTPPKEQTLSSGAMGDNPLCYPRMPGRVNFDLWLHLKRENVTGLENLKLNTISKHFLNDEKHDLEPKQMFKAYRAGPEGRALVAAYCRQDCKLVLDLMEKLEALPSVWEMAKITCTSPEDILYRGQQVKVYTQLVLKATECGYVVEDRRETREEEEEESFQGATVVTPTPGYYLEPIFCLDFASLYPSLMRTKNLSPECLVAPQLWRDAERLCPGGLLSNDVQVREGVVHRFVRSSVHEGLLPRILEQLLSERKRVKKLMDAEADPKLRALLNRKQLALKISANSVYGASGSTKGKLSCRECAEATTAAGREAIDFTCAFVNRRPGFEIIYGDTDSAFARVPPEMRTLGVDALFQHGEGLADEVTAAIAELMPGERCYIKLEFEKIFLPLILYKKKRYAGMCIEDPRKPAKMMARGLELVRRDACKLVKETQRGVIDLLLREGDVRGAAELMLGALRRVLEIPHGGPFALIQQSKSLRSTYHDETSQAQCVVRSLIREREAGSEPQVGDRVDFVVVASRSERVVDKCEDVAYAQRQQLPPDWAHYLETVERPLKAILEVPLQHTQPELLLEINRESAQLKARAKALVAKHCMARHGVTWKPGLLLKGGGVQLKLFPPPPQSAPLPDAPVGQGSSAPSSSARAAPVGPTSAPSASEPPRTAQRTEARPPSQPPATRGFKRETPPPSSLRAAGLRGYFPVKSRRVAEQ